MRRNPRKDLFINLLPNNDFAKNSRLNVVFFIDFDGCFLAKKFVS